MTVWKKASDNSRAVVSRLFFKIVVSWNIALHLHILQCWAKWEPVPVGIDRSCSLRRSLTQRPDCPTYTLPHDNGILYTTPTLQSTIFAWFFSQTGFLLVFEIRLHNNDNFWGAENTTGILCLVATFFRLWATLWQYGRTSGLFFWVTLRCTRILLVYALHLRQCCKVLVRGSIEALSLTLRAVTTRTLMSHRRSLVWMRKLQQDSSAANKL